VALGVADATRQPPLDTIPTEGGLCWYAQPAGLDEAEIERRLRTAGPGLIPAARRATWSAWLRAEHGARRAALAGIDWSITHTSGDTWSSDATATGRFLDVLRAVGLPEVGTPGAPSARVEGAYPRSASAFVLSVETAQVGGLNELRSDHQSGFRAIYLDGSQRTGCALHDVFA
jgi:hypothetical protein